MRYLDPNEFLIEKASFIKKHNEYLLKISCLRYEADKLLEEEFNGDKDLLVSTKLYKDLIKELNKVEMKYIRCKRLSDSNIACKLTINNLDLLVQKTDILYDSLFKELKDFKEQRVSAPMWKEKFGVYKGIVCTISGFYRVIENVSTGQRNFNIYSIK